MEIYRVPPAPKSKLGVLLVDAAETLAETAADPLMVPDENPRVAGRETVIELRSGSVWLLRSSVGALAAQRSGGAGRWSGPNGVPALEHGNEMQVAVFPTWTLKCFHVIDFK